MIENSRIRHIRAHARPTRRRTHKLNAPQTPRKNERKPANPSYRAGARARPVDAPANPEYRPLSGTRRAARTGPAKPHDSADLHTPVLANDLQKICRRIHLHSAQHPDFGSFRGPAVAQWTPGGHRTPLENIGWATVATVFRHGGHLEISSRNIPPSTPTKYPLTTTTNFYREREYIYTVAQTPPIPYAVRDRRVGQRWASSGPGKKFRMIPRELLGQHSGHEP